MATASSDHAVELWDLATRRERMTLEGHTNSVESVAFSPDGKSLASIGFTPELILWDIASGKRLRTWKAERHLGQRVRFRPDGRWVAAETLARTDVLGFVLKFRRGEFDGTAELLAMPVPGDWIVRQGASKDNELKALETILVDELKSRSISRRARSSGRSSSPRADISSTRLGTSQMSVPSTWPRSAPSDQGGGGGSGSLKEMLDWLGDRVGRLVIDDTGTPNEMIQWHDHLASQTNEIAADTEAGRELLKRLLENVSKQTSLTLHQQRRKVKVWIISSGH